MALALVALVSLLAALWAVRRTRSGAAPEPVPRRAEDWLAAGFVAASLGPLLWAFPELAAPDALLASDAQAHAWVAAQIARGVPHGWVDVCACGFPLGPQYQSAVLFLTALLIKLGLPVTSALALLGFGSVLILPGLLMATLRAANVGAAPAALGGAMLVWFAMPFAWAGVADAYLVGGLVSQSLGLALIVLAAWAVLSGPAWALPVLGAVAVGSHALLTALALLVAAPAVVLAAPRVRRRFAWAAAGAIVAGLALYGPGLPTLHVPVSWSRGALELIRTFPRQDLVALAGGDLLDFGRAPGFTALTLVALVGMSIRPRDVPVRTAVLLLLGVVVVSLAARLTPRVEVMSPARAAVFLPMVLAVAVAVGVDSWRRALPAGTGHAVCWAVAVVAVGWGAATRLPWLGERMQLERDWRGDRECGPSTPPGYRTRTVAAWLANLPGGRFVVDPESFALAPGVPLACPSLHGLELASSQPLGASLGGPGTQNGVLNEAFDQLRLSQAGADARAESLGVRSVLHTRTHRPVGAWDVVASRGEVELSVRRGNDDLVGVGCVRRLWRGSDRVIRDRLFQREAWATLLDAPTSFVAIELTDGELTETELDPAGCDPASAVLTPLPREPGAYAADIRSDHDVDVVVRAAAFPAWRFLVDGQGMRTRTVAPGFFSARVPAGSHRIEAVVSPLPFYRAGLLAALAILIALGILSRRDSIARPRAERRATPEADRP